VTGKSGVRRPSADPASRPIAGIETTTRTLEHTAKPGAILFHEDTKSTKFLRYNTSRPS
jgi:hypothetical protein